MRVEWKSRFCVSKPASHRNRREERCSVSVVCDDKTNMCLEMKSQKLEMNIREHNKHQRYMATVNKCLTFPPFLCRIYTSAPAAPFGPSWALWDRETATIIDLWPHIKPRMTSLFDTDLTWLKRFDPASAWPSLTGSETSDSVFVPVETERQQRDQWLRNDGSLESHRWFLMSV